MTQRPARTNPAAARRDAAQSLAIAALSFLAGEPERLARFFDSAGIDPGAIRDAARDAGFLLGVLDHVSSDEELLIAFAGHAAIDPAEVERARAALGGAWERDIP
ncbi:MAG: DUF3572 family protein [Alphaproteobacteria bacterium]|nr:DUF3572 family protein [Alphaproteobacteria bacterium]